MGRVKAWMMEQEEQQMHEAETLAVQEAAQRYAEEHAPAPDFYSKEEFDEWVNYMEQELVSNKLIEGEQK